MAKTSRTEQEALYQAIVKLSGDKDLAYYPSLCSLYDKLSGVRYSKSKNTYEFVTKLDSTIQKGIVK